MTRHIQITDAYVRRRLENNEISRTTADLGQKMINRLEKFSGTGDVLQLTEQQLRDFLASITTINTHNAALGFFKRMCRIYDLTVEETIGKRTVTRFWLEGMKKRREKDDKIPKLDPRVLPALLASCLNTRDRVLISVLAEYGFREGEVAYNPDEDIVGVTLKDVVRNDATRGYWITCHVSKTKCRRVLGVESASLIALWINKDHPRHGDADAPFLCQMNARGGDFGGAMTTEQIYKAFYNVRERAIAAALAAGDPALAKLLKATHPHTLRHHATTTDVAKKVPDSQIKNRRGWTRDSKMIARYDHTDESDADAAYAAACGIDVKPAAAVAVPRQCPACFQMNRPTAQLCDACGMPLDAGTALKLNEKLEKGNSALAALDAETLKALELLKNPAILQALQALTPAAPGK
jgi:integrase